MIRKYVKPALVMYNQNFVQERCANDKDKYTYRLYKVAQNVAAWSNPTCEDSKPNVWKLKSAGTFTGQRAGISVVKPGFLTTVGHRAPEESHCQAGREHLR